MSETMFPLTLHHHVQGKDHEIVVEATLFSVKHVDMFIAILNRAKELMAEDEAPA